MISHELLKQATDIAIPSWCKKKSTRVVWVNWREDSVQIKFTWNDVSDFAVYLDFKAKCLGASDRNRDAVMKKLFEMHAPMGQKPFKDRWGFMRYDFITTEFVSPNQAAKIADELGYEYTVIYATQGNREFMSKIGISIVPGETGKEWISGVFHSYKPLPGKNL